MNHVMHGRVRAWRGFVINFSLVLVSAWLTLFVVDLVLAEYFTSLDKERTAAGVNGYYDGSRWTWGNRVQLNDWGFRDRQIPPRKEDGIIRIVILGDSISWGAGVSMDERYSNILEHMLNDYDTEIQFEVINLSLSGTPTTVQRDILVEYGPVVDPDLVIVGYCLNDTQPLSQDYVSEKRKFWEKYGGIVTGIEMLFRLLSFDAVQRYLGDHWDRVFEALGLFPGWVVGLDRTYALDASEWKEFQRALSEIVSMSSTGHALPPILITLNQAYKVGVHDFKNDTDELWLLQKKWFSQVSATARDVGFTVVNVESRLTDRKWRYEELSINRFDGHPSAELHKVFAIALFDAVLAGISQPIGSNLKLENIHGVRSNLPTIMD